MQPMRAAVVQFQHRANDKAYNLQQVRHFAQQAADAGASIVVCPEMCVTGYWHIRHSSREQIGEVAESIPSGPTLESLVRWASELDISIGAGWIEVDQDQRFYNSYVVAMPDGRWACHRKLHCFINPIFSSGDRYTVFDLPDGTRAGILICWDNNLIENVRATALLGAEVLIAPHQTGGCQSRSPHAMGRIDLALWNNRHNDPESLRAEFQGPKGREWLMRWLPARAHDNGLFLLFSNGVGQDDDEVRTGNAMILDPYGRSLAESRALTDDLVVADLDPSLLEFCTGRRWMRGRRPELYSLLAERTGKELAPHEARFSTEQAHGQKRT